HYKTTADKLGLVNLHGLRHAYAQRRYQELTAHFDEAKQGLLAPIAGGKTYKALSQIEKEWDQRARQILSRELGHSRASIVRIYCG
ncbi:MAG: integrase, partial [Tatlockia sp.]|nr:integrase [Tatlockia sp.]